MTTPREKYERRLETFNEYVESGEIDPETADAVRELVRAYDDHNVMVSCPSGESTRTPGTLMSWLYRLAQFARNRDLTEATLNDLKGDMQAMHDGSHPYVDKNGGITKGTLRSYQAALRKFYRYHEFGVDPDEIPIHSKSASPVDPNDMLTKEEINEAQEAASNARDRALFDLLLYTGQRREAIRTLRLKDVDVQEGTYRLNPNVDGLKGAQDRNGKRPLLGAKGALQNWLDYHPDTSEPENYLITARPSYAAVDPSDPVSGETIRRVMSEIKEETDIEKPMHPHALRHNFVTIAKRDHNLPDDTIKYLIGHDDSSQVMETTYSHLSGDDHIKRAEEGWGIREPDDESPLSPDVCGVCGNPIEPNAKACSRCGTVYTPDARGAIDQIEETISDEKEQAETLEEYKDADAIAQALDDDPKLAAELMDKLGELSDDS
ncbi:tyrosine-type recombinase/integrase [Haloarcula sp. CBA1127]|uniref:tyrosine-type recombinase/integrase n=1 Tax=Haloarcula sp. CBA1127 TaxID=1765055 RepID=UPI00073EAB66|nr:tyrosine-type recombinase/integrase [Haloarcula sp. CBA1127]